MLAKILVDLPSSSKRILGKQIDFTVLLQQHVRHPVKGLFGPSFLIVVGEAMFFQLKFAKLSLKQAVVEPRLQQSFIEQLQRQLLLASSLAEPMELLVAVSAVRDLPIVGTCSVSQ